MYVVLNLNIQRVLTLKDLADLWINSSYVNIGQKQVQIKEAT